MKKYKLEYLIPAMLALAGTFLLIWKVPRLSEAHTLHLLESGEATQGRFISYHDLNMDGFSERLNIYYNNSGNLAVSVSDIRTDGTINQFNLPGELTELGSTLDIHDLDGDGIMDIVVCTEKNDSLFLSIIDDLYGRPTRYTTYFLDRINLYNDNADYHFIPGGMTDLTGDSRPEYVFAVNGGHSLQPRRVYAIDAAEKRVIRSPVSGAALNALDLFDLDRDGRDEVLLNTVPPENFKFPFPFSDSISWLMVLDDSLGFYHPPVPMDPPPSWVSLEPFVHEDENYLLAFHRFQEPGGEYSSTLTIYDDQLCPLKQQYYRGYKKGTMNLWRYPGRVQLEDIRLIRDNKIYTLDFDLEFADSVENEVPFRYRGGYTHDLDRDGEMEYIFLDAFRLCVFRENLRQSSTQDLRWDEHTPRILVSVIEMEEAYPLLFLQVGTEQFTYRYGKNQWYLYRALVYPGIFLVLFGLFFMLILQQDRMVSRRYERERLISRLQLQSIRNQLDPHFTYNALNAVGSLIYKGEKDSAYLYLKGLTDLLRMVSGDASKVTWNLSDELGFVQRYLDIEKLRFGEKFEFMLDVEDELLNNHQVPKMSILTFVENAIKHGLRHKEGTWMLGVSVTRTNLGLKIMIRDNGIGRAAAVKYRSESAGSGIEMMEAYFRQFSEVTGNQASFRVTDLFETDQKPSGTVVEISIT